MLDRVAVHQTRLKTPGLGLDARGVALGGRGIVLLPSLERLVAFLALYTRSGSLEDILRSLSLEVVRSKLGAREVIMTFAAESSDRMDRIAEVARLAGGYTFTGTSRHFVQYRDAGAPFGYDVVELLPADASLALYHNTFSQAYSVERKIEVKNLLLRLEPHLDPLTLREAGPKWIVAEEGLGPALIAYFVRSTVDAEVALAEWPPESSFDDAPIRRYLLRVAALPDRMLPLLTQTPGILLLNPMGDGVAVEVGFRHPVNLRACPVFPRDGLVLFRGHQKDPLSLERLPALGSVLGFAKIGLRGEGQAIQSIASRVGTPPTVSLTLRLVPSFDPWRGVTATFVRSEDLLLLRRVAYVLGADTLRRATVAFTAGGAYVRHPGGIEAIPVGEFFRELYPGLFIPAGFDPLPAVAPDVLHKALGAPLGHVLFVTRTTQVIGVEGASFVPLETALLQAHSWAPVASLAIDPALVEPIPEIVLDSPGFRPMRDVADEEQKPSP